MIAQTLRSLLFYVLFIGFTILLAIPLGIVAALKKGFFPFGLKVGFFWARANLFLLRWLVGIRTEVTGFQNIPEGGCIIAAKHQSDWDIFAILPHTVRPAFIAKRELLDIPFFGWAAKALGTISVDRAKGAEAIPAMLEDAARAIDEGARIVIFPEGTRRAPLAPPQYRIGTARLYEALNVPVVPVALNSGLFWGRNSPVLWPGKAKARFLEPIPPGLPADEFRAVLESRIEAATNELILDAVRAGLARPIPPALRRQIDALEKTAASAQGTG
ncbi:MAG TPA: lysophospholipid acyltransferase family protein [Devosiaceae bacterium]